MKYTCADYRACPVPHTYHPGCPSCTDRKAALSLVQATPNLFMALREILDCKSLEEAQLIAEEALRRFVHA